MGNVCHPLCACGAPVVVNEWRVPNYDDGGGLDSFDIEYAFEDVCGNCYIKRETMDILGLFSEPQETEDDLPF